MLQIDLDGTQQFAAPKDVQRHPVKREIEHVDLVLLDRAQRAALIAEGAAIIKANAAAEEAGVDPTALAEIVLRLVESGVAEDDAIAQGLTEVEEHNRANAVAAAAAAEHEAADAVVTEPEPTPEG